MSTEWETTSRERSTLFMLRWLVAATRLLGRRLTRWVLIPTVLYFICFAAAARQSSRDYLRRVLPRSPTLWDVARHFHTFASCALDRVVLLGGKTGGIRVNMHYTPRARAIRTSGKGCLLLMAHVGSFEAIRAKGVIEFQLPLRIVMDREHGRMYTNILEKIRPELKNFVLDSSQRGPALVLKIKQALDEQNMVCIMADRPRAGEPQVTVDFLGGRANLPASPWIMAGVLNVPVMIGFVLYRNGGYESYIEDFADAVTLDRGRRLESAQAYAQRYAERMEHYVRNAPYNWFNFYDFWAQETLPHDTAQS